MKSSRKTLVLLGLYLLLIACLLVGTWAYTVSQLNLAKSTAGVYATPEEAMSALLYPDGRQVEPQYIRRSGPSCGIICSPHIWFVHVAGSGVGGGAYFLHTRQGWVHMPESTFPEFVGLGMIAFGLAAETP